MDNMRMKRIVLAALFYLSVAGALHAESNVREPILVNLSGSTSTSGNNTLVAAVGNKRIMVTAFSLITTSTDVVTVKFQSGASGTDLWTVPMVCASTVSYFGANLAVPFKQGAIFGAEYGTLLNLNLSAAKSVTYSIGYYLAD